MADGQLNRWQANDNDFAVRLELADVEGFFSKKLTIEPGTRALFMERGQMVGEVPPGEYSLQGVMDRLRFWTKKSTVVILTKGGQVPFQLQCAGLPTRELIEVEVVLRLSVQMEDVALFLKNMMGDRRTLTKDDLQCEILPVVQQALYEAVGRLSIRDMTGEQARGDLEVYVSQALGTALKRNGLGFGQIQTLSVCHPKYDDHRRRTGEIWLQRLDLEHEKSASKLEADRLFARIEEREHQDELEVLAEQVAADRMEGDLAVKLRRVGIRKQLRAAILAGQFDKIQSQEELASFLRERDKDRLIRQEESDSLAATLREKTQDRAVLREHLLRKLDIEQQFDLQSVRVSLDYAQKMRTRQHEIELASLSDSEDARKWKANLEREGVEAQQRQGGELKRLEHDRAAVRLADGTRREAELEDTRHQHEILRIQGEIEIAQAERRRRIALADAEVERSLQEALDARDRREADSQLERLEKLRSIKNARKQAEFDRAEQTQRRLHEQEIAKGKGAIEKIQAHRGLSPAELMAVSENANIIAEVEKHRAAQEATIETAKAQQAAQQAADAGAAELRNQLAKAHETRADGTVAAYQQALQTQQSTFDQFGKLVDNITRNLAPQPGSTVVVSDGSATKITGPPVVGRSEERVVICTGCRTENREGDRCCRQCGKNL
jgi:hypothetical protein